MNNILVTCLLLSSISTQAAKLIHAESFKDPKTGHVKVSLNSGFGETGFEQAEAICFIGSGDEVCGDVNDEAKASQARYREGDHGQFKVNSCELKKNDMGVVVKVNYTRINDYEDDQKISVVITDCN